MARWGAGFNGERELGFAAVMREGRCRDGKPSESWGAGREGGRWDGCGRCSARGLQAEQLRCICRTPPLREDREGGASEATARSAWGAVAVRRRGRGRCTAVPCLAGAAGRARRRPRTRGGRGWRRGSGGPPQRQAGPRRAGGRPFGAGAGPPPSGPTPLSGLGAATAGVWSGSPAGAEPSAEAAPLTWPGPGARSSAEDATVRLGLPAGRGRSKTLPTASLTARPGGEGGDCSPHHTHRRARTQTRRHTDTQMSSARVGRGALDGPPLVLLFSRPWLRKTPPFASPPRSSRPNPRPSGPQPLPAPPSDGAPEQGRLQPGPPVRPAPAARCWAGGGGAPRRTLAL